MTVQGEPLAQNPPQEENAPRRRQPVWAPNPAVPLASRLLAYAFGITIVLTIILARVHLRPPDLPVMPLQWREYVNDDITLKYPDWSDPTEVQESYRGLATYLPGLPGRMRITSFTQYPSTYNRIQAITCRSPFDTRSDHAFAVMAERYLRSAYVNYRRGETLIRQDSGEEWHYFTGQMADETRRPIRGAWILRTQGTRVLVLEAISSTQGWATMSDIFALLAISAEIHRDPEWEFRL